MVSVLREAERYKRNDFGLAHERELQTKVNELTERVKRLENQRSTLRTEISELEHNYNITVDQLEASEERCAGLLIDLTETQGMLQDMQNFHLNQTAPVTLVDSVPSTRKRRRTPTTVSSGAVFDGQPPDPHSSSSSPTTSQ
jgi:predicted nuclease with TOPRIM domain